MTESMNNDVNATEGESRIEPIQDGDAIHKQRKKLQVMTKLILSFAVILSIIIMPIIYKGNKMNGIGTGRQVMVPMEETTMEVLSAKFATFSGHSKSTLHMISATSVSLTTPLIESNSWSSVTSHSSVKITKTTTSIATTTRKQFVLPPAKKRVSPRRKSLMNEKVAQNFTVDKVLVMKNDKIILSMYQSNGEWQTRKVLLVDKYPNQQALLYTCSVCKELSLISLNGFLFVVHGLGSIIQIKPELRKEKPDKFYKLPNTKKLMNHGFLSVEDKMIDTNMLLLADQTRNHIIQYNLRNKEKKILKRIRRPSSVHYNFHKNKFYYIVSQPQLKKISILDSKWQSVKYINRGFSKAFVVFCTLEGSLLVGDKGKKQIKEVKMKGKMSVLKKMKYKYVGMSYLYPFLWVAEQWGNRILIEKQGMYEQ